MRIQYSLFFVIVFGFFSGSQISLPEQGEATTLAIGFIKGGNVQSLTALDRRNVARFGITVTGSASKCELLELSLVPRPIPLKSHRSGVFGDVRITSGGRDLSECADLSDRAGRAPAVVKR